MWTLFNTWDILTELFLVLHVIWLKKLGAIDKRIAYFFLFAI